jgi:hypothetical protein
MKVYRIYAGPVGNEKQIAEFLLTEGCDAYCEITELDAQGAPQFERPVPLVLADNQRLIIVPHNAEISARWVEP